MIRLVEEQPSEQQNNRPTDQVRSTESFSIYAGETLLKNLNIDSTTFQRIILTLHMCDAIEEEMLSRRKTVYTLKTAA